MKCNSKYEKAPLQLYNKPSAMSFHLPRKCFLKRLRWETMCYITKSFLKIPSCFPHELMKIHCRPVQSQTSWQKYYYTGIFENCFCPRLSHARARTSVKKELNLATVLVCIVFVFLFCNIPRVFVNCYEFLSSEEVIRWADIWCEVFFCAVRQGLKFWLNTTLGGICLYKGLLLESKAHRSWRHTTFNF